MKIKKWIALLCACALALGQSVALATDAAPDNAEQGTVTKLESTDDNDSEQTSENKDTEQGSVVESKDEEKTADKIKSLKESVEKLKAKEKSAENKILDSGSIASAGIGAMQAASAQAEKNADKDAEQDMRAYLATFRCDYGQGRNILGGEKNIQLPGASELTQFVTEYKQLAANLKSDKTALGMRPGIEAEVVFDSATTGLYDDVSIGRQPGAFTSLSRALLDENSADAKAWQAQKDASDKKLKTGLKVAGAGVVASIAGNEVIKVAANGGDDAGQGDASGNGGILAAIGGGQNSSAGVQNAGASNGIDSEIQRAQAAVDTLRSDVSAQADSLNNDVLTVQSDATAKEIDDTTIIDSAVKDSAASKKAIGAALIAADAALTSAKEVDAPVMTECKLELKKDDPIQGVDTDEDDDVDVDEDESDEDFAKRKATYDKKLQAAEKKLARCKEDAKTKYDSELKTYQNKTKKFADEAERQLNIARTGLNSMQSALSSAKTALSNAVAQQQKQAEQEAEEKRAKEELQQQINVQADRVTAAVAKVDDYYSKARTLSQSATAESVTDEATESAEELISDLKKAIDEDLVQIKTVQEKAAELTETAQNASDVAAATKTAETAENYAEQALKHKNAIAEALEKIKTAKADAKKKYDQENSEESD